jgi:hypothetical protein
MRCPSFETLALYDRQQLAITLKDDVTRHLSQPCSRCQERLSWFQEAATALRTPLERGPQRLIDNARRLFQQSRYAETALPDLLFARLAFDSSSQDRRMGARGVEFSSQNSRHLLYQTELPEQQSFDIDIAIKRANDHQITLRGQILSSEESDNFTAKLTVDLYKAGQRIERAAANSFGEFVFSDLPAADYSLQIKAGNWTTVINLPAAN